MFFIVDARKRNAPGQDEFVWQRLWEMRDVVPVRGVWPAVVSSPCPLLPDEAADAMLLETGVQVPGATAWATLQLDIMTCMSATGEVSIERLDEELANCVDRGEARHEDGNWATSCLAKDSHLNRRLAIWVRGWGSLVARRGDDPRQLATLRRLEDLAAHVRETLWQASLRLARDRGHCAAIDVAGARVLQHGTEMHARWRHAVDASGLRHRNLLTLSPWDVFPAGVPADAGHLDLLPLIACADSVTFHREVEIDHWNVSEFRSFHERVGAILRRNSDLPLIAKQV